MFRYKKLYEITEKQLKKKEQEIYDLKMENQKLKNDKMELGIYRQTIDTITSKLVAMPHEIATERQKMALGIVKA